MHYNLLLIRVAPLFSTPQKDVEMAGVKGRKLQYKGTIAATSFKFDQYFILAREKAYILSFNALTHCYDRESAIVAPMISSFSLF